MAMRLGRLALSWAALAVMAACSPAAPSGADTDTATGDDDTAAGGDTTSADDVAGVDTGEAVADTDGSAGDADPDTVTLDTSVVDDSELPDTMVGGDTGRADADDVMDADPLDGAACVAGEVESGSCGACGIQRRTCEGGVWTEWVCDDPGHQCDPGDQRCDGVASVRRCGALASGCRVWLGSEPCGGTLVCDEGLCHEPACVPECDGRVCGDNGCGGVCGTCAESAYCGVDGRCVAQTVTDLILVIGQSNAAGYGSGPATVTSVPGAYEIDIAGGTSAWLPLAFPTGQGSGAAYLSHETGFGLALAEAWNAHGRESVFVFAAIPGSALVEEADTGTGDWTDTLDNDGLYDFAVHGWTTARAAIEAAEDRRLGYSAAIWLQGETDALHPDVGVAEYTAGFEALYHRLSADIALDGFWLAEIGYTLHEPEVQRPRFVAIQDAQDQLAVRADLGVTLVSRVAMTETRRCDVDGLESTTCGLVDAFHYRTDVYEALGREIATHGWSAVTTGVRPIAPYAAPSSPVTCLGATSAERTLIAAYDEACYRCPSVADLSYWVDSTEGSSVSAVAAQITSICDAHGYPGWSACRRQQENAELGGCPDGWGYLPAHSERCFQVCQ